MANRINHERRQLILRMLCEGNSIRSTSRITGCEKRTVGRAILEFGNACETFLDDYMRNLTMKHVEVDEIWSFVGKKQSRLTVEEKETRHDICDVYLWTCLDKETKLVPSYLVGKRSADNARRLMVDLSKRQRKQNQRPHDSDNHAYQTGEYQRIQISTDGFNVYPEAIDLAFSQYAAHGVLIKEYRNASIAYTPSEMVGTDRRVISGNINKFTICTSDVERHNLTIRTLMKRFTRLALGFSKKLEYHEAAIAMFLAYYNFVWRTRHADNSGQPGRLRPTAAMMAKVTNRLWNFGDLYDEVLNYG